jgi:hypothetical protein
MWRGILIGLQRVICRLGAFFIISGFKCVGYRQMFRIGLTRLCAGAIINLNLHLLSAGSNQPMRDFKQTLPTLPITLLKVRRLAQASSQKWDVKGVLKRDEYHRA